MSPSTLSITVIETPWPTGTEGSIYREVDGHWNHVGAIRTHMPASELVGSGTLMLVTPPDTSFWAYETTTTGDVHFDGPYPCRP